MIITGVLLALGGVLRIVLIWMQARSEISIIGGADAPTVQLIWEHFGWQIIRRIILPIVFGTACAVSSAIHLKKGGK